MKRTIKLAAVVLAVIALTMSLALSVFAAVEKTMKVGETATLMMSETPYVSSDPSVVEVRDDGNKTYSAIAKAEGTATLTGATWMGSAGTDYVITVKTQKTDSVGGAGNSSSVNLPSVKDMHDELDDMQKEILGPTYYVQKVMSVIVPAFIIFVFVLVITSILKMRKLQNAVQALASGATPENVGAAIAAFNKTKGPVKWVLTSNSNDNRVRFSVWREIYNTAVLSSPYVSYEDKVALRLAMMQFNVPGLKEPVSAEKAAAEAVARKAAQEEFGRGGEENVWYNLKYLHTCDLYYDVRLVTGDTDSQVDAIVVDPARGVFMLEVKSSGGRKATDGNKYVSFADLTSDPSNQIIRHANDMTALFPSLAGRIINALVFSWPYNDERRLLDRSNIPPYVSYDVLTVEQLLSYFPARTAGPITEEERLAIAAQLRTRARESIVR